MQSATLIYTFTILNVFDMNLIRIFLLDQFLVFDLLGECGRFRRLFLPWKQFISDNFIYQFWSRSYLLLKKTHNKTTNEKDKAFNLRIQF